MRSALAHKQQRYSRLDTVLRNRPCSAFRRIWTSHIARRLFRSKIAQSSRQEALGFVTKHCNVSRHAVAFDCQAGAIRTSFLSRTQLRLVSSATQFLRLGKGGRD